MVEICTLVINNAFSLNDPLTVTSVSTSYIEERSKTELQHEESYQCPVYCDHKGTPPTHHLFKGREESYSVCERVDF